MQRRTFIIGATGLVAAPTIAAAEVGWSKPFPVHFKSGRGDSEGMDWKDIQAAVHAFQSRPNPRNGDSVRVTGHIDEAERLQGFRDLALQRAQFVALEFSELDKSPGRARPRRGLGIVVDVAGPSADNRVALVSWRVKT